MCLICESQFRDKIEEDIMKPGPNNTMKKIADRYKVPYNHVVNHKKSHMPDTIDEARKIIEERCRDKGINRVITDIEILDMIIGKAPEILDNVTLQDVIRAIKLKAELLGDLKQNDSAAMVEWVEHVELE